MTAKSVLVRPQGLRPRARAPTFATPLVGRVKSESENFGKEPNRELDLDVFEIDSPVLALTP